jgi:hypothetical protein
MLLELLIVDDGRADLSPIEREFPALSVGRTATAPVVRVPPDWLDDRGGLVDLDGRIQVAAESGTLALEVAFDGDPVDAALRVATRYQRLGARRNFASDGKIFDRLLTRHRALHPLDKPLARADYDHALDTWQWLLRLDDEAGAAVQIAALFRDVDRLVSEADTRVEQLAPDYQELKRAHAAGGVAMAREVLDGLGLPADVELRALELIQANERAGTEREVALLNDAAALSFFSLDGAGFLDHYGPQHARREIAYSLRRMSGGARARLASIGLRRDLRPLVAAGLRALQVAR